MKLLLPLSLAAAVLLSGCVSTYSRGSVAVYETRPAYGYGYSQYTVYPPVYVPVYRRPPPQVYVRPPGPHYHGWHHHWR